MVTLQSDWSLFGVFVAAVGVAPRFALIPVFSLLFASSDSAGWRPVYLGGGLIDVACAAVLAVIL
jgi:hypothetical protein